MDELSVELKPDIKTYDIDIAGHVNNIVYIRWFEELRTKLFNNYFNLQDLLSNNLYPVVVSTNINYKKYLKLFDKPVGIMSMECCNHGIITLKVEMKLEEKIVAFGEQKCVLMNLTTGEMNKEKLKSI
ncbi:MAG: acyl-CoA thioesterase [Ignavibacteriaceae bacterium]